jgi:hypothetical protein
MMPVTAHGVCATLSPETTSHASGSQAVPRRVYHTATVCVCHYGRDTGCACVHACVRARATVCVCEREKGLWQRGTLSQREDSDAVPAPACRSAGEKEGEED